MKVAARILMAVSLVVGVLAAATAYVAPLSRGAALKGLTLSAPAGQAPDGSPLVEPKATLTPELIDSLRANNVKYVKVKEFQARDIVQRWPGLWWFGAAVIGLATAAMMLRSVKKAALSAPGKIGAAPPEESLAGIRTTIASLERDLPSAADEKTRLGMIVERIGAAQKTHVDAFLESRPVIQGRLGLSGFASVMDRFSAGERQINRAWCAAVDGVLEEATQCLRVGDACFAETQERLAGR